MLQIYCDEPYLDNEAEVTAYVDDFLAAGEAERAMAKNQGPSYAELLERKSKQRLANSA